MASLRRLFLSQTCVLAAPSPGTGINRGGLKPIEEQMTEPRIIIVGGGFGGAAGNSELAP